MMVFSPSSVYAIEDDGENARYAKVIQHGNRLFVHSLCLIPPPEGARLVNYRDAVEGASAFSALTFLDLYWNSRVQGRVFVRLYSDAPKAKKFMTTCTGKNGETYKGTCMFSPSSVDEMEHNSEEEIDQNMAPIIYFHQNQTNKSPQISPISESSDSMACSLYQMSSNRPSFASIKEEQTSEGSQITTVFDAESSTFTTSLLPCRKSNKRKSTRLDSIKSDGTSFTSSTKVTLRRKGTSKRSVREQDINLLSPALLCVSPNELYFYFIRSGKSREYDIVLGEVVSGMTILENASMQFPVTNVSIIDCGVAIRRWEKQIS